jgi:hypothetical protein
MALPKGGSRKISVDGTTYCWRIRRKATQLQADYGIGRIHVAVQLATEPGTTLILFTDRPHPKDWGTTKVIPITPSDVINWVRQAIELGWRPATHGAQARFRVRDNALEKVTVEQGS